MRILGCALIAVAALLGLAPVAMAGDRADGAPAPVVGTLPGSESRGVSDQQPEPQSEVSMLAVTLTAAAAVAAAGSGAAQAVTRRRAVSRPPSQRSG